MIFEPTDSEILDFFDVGFHSKNQKREDIFFALLIFTANL